MQEGAQLRLVLPNGEETSLVVSSLTRCRARYNPAISPGDVDAVVPGYRICKVMLKDGVSKFTRDAQETSCFARHPSGRVHSLTLSFDVVEDGAMVADLLTLVCWRLKKLSLKNEPSDHAKLDLSALAEACPALEGLDIEDFDVVVTVDSDALRVWPIQKIEIYGSTSVPDLATCLRNHSYRMARELATLSVCRLHHSTCDTREVESLNEHDGDFLPLTKEKLPNEAKAALTSVVKSRKGGIPRLL